VDIIPSFNCSSISLQVPWQTFSTSSGFESKGEITSQARGLRSVTSVSNEAGAAQMIRVTFSRVCGPMWTAWLPATIAVASTCVGTVSHMFALPALRRFFSFFLIKTLNTHAINLVQYIEIGSHGNRVGSQSGSFTSSSLPLQPLNQHQMFNNMLVQTEVAGTGNLIIKVKTSGLLEEDNHCTTRPKARLCFWTSHGQATHKRRFLQ